MIIEKFGKSIEINGITYTVGMEITGTRESEHKGLNGYITEIRTGDDMDTENIGPDIYCSFEPPESLEEIARLEAVFSELYGETKQIEDIILDLVIMAPDMIAPIQTEGTVNIVDSVMEYFIKQYEKADFRVVPGHWPNFQSENEVDEWIEIMSKVDKAFEANEKKRTENELIEAYDLRADKRITFADLINYGNNNDATEAALFSYAIRRLSAMLEALKNAGAIYGRNSTVDLNEMLYSDESDFNAFLKDIENSGHIIWHVDDILLSMRDEYPLINEDDAKDILSSMLNHHNASYGISWDSIELEAELNGFDEKHYSRMAEAFPFSLKKGELDWVNQYMTKEEWDNGNYEEFSMSLTDSEDIRSLVKQLVRREHLVSEFETRVAYYYFSLMRFAKDNNLLDLATLAPHLTAIMVRKIMDNDEECEV